MSDLASLTSQLADNLAQLAQLDELLLADPDNAELRAIREDIAQVITLTRELQQAAGQLPQEEAKQLEQTVGATTNHDAPSSSTITETQTAASSIGGYNAPAAAASSSAAAIASSISLPPFAASSSSSASSALLPVNGVYPPGARVMALYPKDGKYYISRIDRVDTGADEYTVTYLEYNQVGTIGFDSVRPWIHATPEQLRIANTPVKALFPEDGLFYNASLEGPSGSMPGYYAIKFGHLGGKKKRVVDVPLYDIVINERFMDAKTMQFTSAASASAKASAQLSEEMPVPEYLVVQPTDSDAIKVRNEKKGRGINCWSRPECRDRCLC